MMKPTYTMDDLLDIMHRLRRECPWDAKQSHESLKQYLLEETYEVLHAIDDSDWNELARELGDLLLQVLFHSEIASESGRFSFSDVVDHISKKLIKRHPHVFADKSVHSAKEVQENWEHIKHRDEGRDSLLSGIPKSAPALLQAQRLQSKAATVGFEWDHISGVIEKIEEEWNEFKSAFENQQPEEQKAELGDLLFSLVNLSRFIHVTAEDALRQTNLKFIRRFQYIEEQYQNDPAALKKASLQELDGHWEDSKKSEQP